MLKEKIKEIKEFINNNMKLFLEPDEYNKIEIIGRILRIIVDGKVVKELKLNSDFLLKEAKKMLYLNRTMNTNEEKVNPLEADRKERKKYWMNPPNTIRIPYFITTYLVYVAFTEKLPTMIEIGLFYIEMFTKEITRAEMIDKFIRNQAYAPGEEIGDILVEDRASVGTLIPFNGESFESKLLMFKENIDVVGLPISDFSTYQLFNRIYRNYGSITRDLCNLLKLDNAGQKVYYSSVLDRDGIDMLLNDLPICSYSKTTGGEELKDDKDSERHTEKIKRGIYLKFDIDFESNSVSLLEDKLIPALLEIVEEVKSLTEDKIRIVDTGLLKAEIETNFSDLLEFNGFNLN